MKRKIILTAFFGIFIFAGVSNGQVYKVYSIVLDPRSDSGDTVVIRYTGLENPNLQLVEAVLSAPTEAACLASRDFSTAVPVGPERASLTYEPETGTYRLRWSVERANRNSCRVLLVRNAIAGSDLAMWQSSYGTGGLFDDEPGKEEVLPSGANARPVSRIASTYTVMFGGGLSGL